MLTSLVVLPLLFKTAQVFTAVREAWRGATVVRRWPAMEARMVCILLEVSSFVVY
jgi:hypothetical protein